MFCRCWFGPAIASKAKQGLGFGVSIGMVGCSGFGTWGLGLRVSKVSDGVGFWVQG